MADILTLVLQIFTLFLVLIMTIFSQKGFSAMTRNIEGVKELIGKIQVKASPIKRSAKCKVCGRLEDDHTVAEARECGIIKEA